MRNFFVAFFIILSTISYAKERSFVYDDQGKRDPLWPLVSPNGIVNTYETDLLISDLSLEGIMGGESGKGNLAIINGRIVQTDDKIGQFIVIKIDEESVVLKKKDQEYKLKLKKGE